MYKMYENGLTDKHWQVVKKLNEGLEAVIKNKHGRTRKIKINDSIRQGGVLSVILFGMIMDQISKELSKEDLGIQISGTDLKVSSLLWVDDVVLLETYEEKMKRILEVVNETSKKYHIEFGESKSKAMKIGKVRPKFYLGDMELQYTESYKYLGYMTNTRNDLGIHLNSIKGKVEGAYQKTIALASNPTLKWVELETY